MKFIAVTKVLALSTFFSAAFADAATASGGGRKINVSFTLLLYFPRVCCSWLLK